MGIKETLEELYSRSMDSERIRQLDERDLRIFLMVLSILLSILISAIVASMPTANNWYSDPYVMDVK